MSVSDEYRKLKISQGIRELLKQGNKVTTAEVKSLVETVDALDLTKPQFLSNTYKLTEKENASASKFNNTFKQIIEDMSVAYKTLILLTNKTNDSFDKWNVEAQNINNKLDSLEDRIDAILLLANDTDGYFTTVADNFTNVDYIDLTLSSVGINLDKSVLTMPPDDETSNERLVLTNLDDTKVSLRVLNKNSVISTTSTTGTDITYPFSQWPDYYTVQVNFSTPKVLTLEYKVQLGLTEQELNRIEVKLNSQSSSGQLAITPLYSTDNTNWSQLDTENYTQTTFDTAIFTFKTISAKWIKFYITKSAPDLFNGESYSYYVGFQEISFFNNVYSTSDATFISRPAYTEYQGSVFEFNKLTMEACEEVPTDTAIDYFITTTYDEDDIDTNFDADTAIWTPITPTNRGLENNSILNMGDIASTTFTGINISYEGTAADSDYISPATPFNLLSDVSGTLTSESVAATDIRYIFQNNNNFILNAQVKATDYTGSGTGNGIDVDFTNLILLRNVGVKGLNPQAEASYVNGVLKGWRFEDPYYVTTVQVENSEGLTIDFGQNYDQKYGVIIDNSQPQIGKVLIAGKTQLKDNYHTVKVHKSRWQILDHDANSIAALKTIDPLYPYNHKMLIEGYNYGPDVKTEEKIYNGVDTFAAYKLKKVSVLDFKSSARDDNYGIYAIDYDATNTHTGGNSPTMVFLVKSDTANTGIADETFDMIVKEISNPQRYVRVKAVLQTDDADVTPVFHGYKLKFGA